MSDRATQSLIDVYREITHLDADADVDLTAPLSDTPYWDSVSQIELIVNAEELYGVRLGEADLRDCRTLGDFIASVERRADAG
ncbi:acyl carrier protein [Streptomyces hydrogenans]